MEYQSIKMTQGFPKENGFYMFDVRGIIIGGQVDHGKIYLSASLDSYGFTGRDNEVLNPQEVIYAYAKISLQF